MGLSLQDPHQELKGKNVLIIWGSPELTAAQFGLEPGQLGALLQEGRQRLSTARAQRPRPHLDTKMLAAWNGERQLGSGRVCLGWTCCCCPGPARFWGFVATSPAGTGEPRMEVVGGLGSRAVGTHGGSSLGLPALGYCSGLVFLPCCQQRAAILFPRLSPAPRLGLWGKGLSWGLRTQVGTETVSAAGLVEGPQLCVCLSRHPAAEPQALFPQ